MKDNDEVIKVFEKDEMSLKEVRRHWSARELLSKEGIFFLKDIVKILEIDSAKIKKKARELAAVNKSCWQVMGARKVWNHWVVRMKVFAPYYKKHLEPKVRSIKKEWNGNTMLKQKGVFVLADVCRLIPFNSHQLRYQSKQNPRSREEYGVWKDQEMNAFLVDMELFSKWINRLWEGDFDRKNGPPPRSAKRKNKRKTPQRQDPEDIS